MTGTAEATAALAVEGVTVKFGGLTALDEVSFACAPGEILGLVGPNGAGKTTALNVMSGIIKPSSGRVLIHGHRCNHAPAHVRARMGLARTFQRVALFPALSVRDHLRVAAEAAAGSRLARRRREDRDQRSSRDIDVLIDRVGLRPYADANVLALSLGTLRLVELAMVLATDSDVLLLDEPTSGLPKPERERMRALLEELSREDNVAIVLVEHDVNLVSRLADRVAVLDFGRVLAVGPPQEVFSDKAVHLAYFGSKDQWQD